MVDPWVAWKAEMMADLRVYMWVDSSVIHSVFRLDASDCLSEVYSDGWTDKMSDQQLVRQAKALDECSEAE